MFNFNAAGRTDSYVSCIIPVNDINAVGRTDSNINAVGRTDSYDSCIIPVNNINAVGHTDSSFLFFHSGARGAFFGRFSSGFCLSNNLTRN